MESLSIKLEIFSRFISRRSEGVRRVGAALFYFACGLAACVAQAIAGEPEEYD